MKTAEKFAQWFHDGTTWHTSDYTDMEDAMTGEFETDREERQTETQTLVRYVFSDGSAIVAGENAWDIEGEEPFSWQSSLNWED